MRIGILTDPHLAPAGSPPVRWHSELLFDDAADRYTRALHILAERDPEVIVVLGDLTHFGDADSMDEFLALTARSTCLVLVIPGNHDVVPEDEALGRGLDRNARVNVVQLMGTRRVGDLVFHGIGVLPVDDNEHYAARIAHPVPPGSVVLSHFPAVSLAERFEGRLLYAGDLENRMELEQAIRHESVPSLVLSGHLHARAAEARGGLLQLTFGALIEAPFDVAIAEIELDEARGSVRIEQLGPEVASSAAIEQRRYGFDYVSGTWVAAV